MFRHSSVDWILIYCRDREANVSGQMHPLPGLSNLAPGPLSKPHTLHSHILFSESQPSFIIFLEHFCLSEMCSYTLGCLVWKIERDVCVETSLPYEGNIYIHCYAHFCLWPCLRFLEGCPDWNVAFWLETVPTSLVYHMRLSTIQWFDFCPS